VRRTKSKEYRRQAEEWCFELLRDAFPEEIVEDMNRDELWNLAFPETHFLQVCKHPYKVDEDGNPETFKRMKLFRNSPRWIYKQIKKNPLITKDELSRAV